jgi:TolB-like protein
MIYGFGRYQLDTDKGELRADGAARPVEPQVFALLRMLIENRERLVGKDEIVDEVWKGRFISDSAVASRVKSARQAIGDDGRAQRLIRTIHKQGFRFVADVETIRPPPAQAAEAPQPPPPDQRPLLSRPSIAVLPFTLVGAAGPYAPIADALPHDLIVELSRLRWLFVIARGSSFQFRGADTKIEAVGAALNVRYCLSGMVEIERGRIVVTVELGDTEDGGVVWSDCYGGEIGAVHEIRARIVQAVVGALELQIPLNEARRALSDPQHLDAWSAYHLGLRHMYRFSRDGNERAAALFEEAIAREPGFARAYAGLSFTHFETAFLGFPDAEEAARRARRYATIGLDHDPLDPFCNLVMGRASWLDGDLEASLPWLDRAIELNPNYAQARYSSAWTKTLLGQGVEGRTLVDSAVDLSPLDPLLYGMLGVRAFSHMVLGEAAEAAHWAERAARAPGAHALIDMIAAVAHGMNGGEALARRWTQSARRRHPGLAASDFLRAFPFRDPAMRQRIARTLSHLDFPTAPRA